LALFGKKQFHKSAMSQQKNNTENSDEKPKQSSVIINQTRVQLPLETVPIPQPEYVHLPLPKFVPVKINTIKIDYQPIRYGVPVEEYETPQKESNTTQTSLEPQTLPPNSLTPITPKVIETSEVQPPTVEQIHQMRDDSVMNNYSIQFLPIAQKKLSYEQMLGITKPEPILKHYLDLLRKFDKEDKHFRTKHSAIKKRRKKYKINWEDIALKTLIIVTALMGLFVLIAFMHDKFIARII
jgi:hypothetical protein